LFISWKVIFCKLFFKLSCICLSLEKLVNRKYFPVKEKFDLVFRIIFSFYFRRKTLYRNYEKFKNVMLFADYIKFGPQTFDCYIFCFETFFSILSLRIWFNLIFITTLVFISMIIIWFSFMIFLIDFFYLLDLVIILLIVIYFIWNNLWNYIFF